MFAYVCSKSFFKHRVTVVWSVVVVVVPSVASYCCCWPDVCISFGAVSFYVHQTDAMHTYTRRMQIPIATDFLFSYQKHLHIHSIHPHKFPPSIVRNPICKLSMQISDNVITLLNSDVAVRVLKSPLATYKGSSLDAADAKMDSILSDTLGTAQVPRTLITPTPPTLLNSSPSIT